MRQRAFGLLDQVLSGLSNFITVALVARALGTVDFGHFAVAYALLTTLLTLVRSRWGTELSTTGDEAATLARLRRLLGAMVAATPVLVVLVLAPALVVTGVDTWPTVLLVSVATPLVCAQDLCRYAAMAAGRAGVAVASDGIWVVVVAAGWAAGLSAVTALVSWLAAAALATVVATVLLHTAPARSGAWRTLRERHPTGEVLAIGAVATALASFAALSAATAFLGSPAAGALRGASSLMAPINAMMAFASVALLPVLHRRRRSRSGDLRFSGQLALALAAVAAVWGVLLQVLPDVVGDALLGETWTGTRGVLPWTAVEYVSLALGYGAAIGLQARKAAAPLFRLAFLYAAFLTVGGLIGASVAADASGVAAALALASIVGAAANWTALALHVRREVPGTA